MPRGTYHRSAPGDPDYRTEERFREPLLDAFAALGPSVASSAIHKWLAQRLEPTLLPGDLENANKGRTVRWWMLVHTIRQRLSEEGLVRPGIRSRSSGRQNGSPHGLWELTEKGKQLIESRKSGRPPAPSEAPGA
jgi:hypothetical protein